MATETSTATSSIEALAADLKLARAALKHALERRARARKNNLPQKFQRECEVIQLRKRARKLEEWLVAARRREWERDNRE